MIIFWLLVATVILINILSLIFNDLRLQIIKWAEEQPSRIKNNSLEDKEKITVFIQGMLLIIFFGFLMLLELSMEIIGLLTDQWIAFAFLILTSFIMFGLSKILSKETKQMVSIGYRIFYIIFLTFLIVNNYHLHINLLLWQ